MTATIQIFSSRMGYNSRAGGGGGGAQLKSPFTHLRTHSEERRLRVMFKQIMGLN